MIGRNSLLRVVWHRKRLPMDAVDDPSSGQVVWGLGQTDLVGGNPAHGRGMELDDL